MPKQLPYQLNEEISNSKTTLVLTLEEYRKYLEFLLRNNTSGLELEMLLLGVIQERCPDVLKLILDYAADGLPAYPAIYTVGMEVEYQTGDMEHREKSIIKDYYKISRLLSLQNGKLISIDDVIPGLPKDFA